MARSEIPAPSAPAERPDSGTDKHQRGLYRKFLVARTDGRHLEGGKHWGCEYFVLDLTHDSFAAPALRAYADACANEYPALAADLRAKAGPAAPVAPSRLSEQEADALIRRLKNATSEWERRSVYGGGFTDASQELAAASEALRAALLAAPASPTGIGAAPKLEGQALGDAKEAWREALTTALQGAWDDFVADTGCFPSCLDAVKTRKGVEITANFERSNFVWMAAGWLLSKHPEIATALGALPSSPEKSSAPASPGGQPELPPYNLPQGDGWVGGTNRDNPYRPYWRGVHLDRRTTEQRVIDYWRERVSYGVAYRLAQAIDGQSTSLTCAPAEIGLDGLCDAVVAAVLRRNPAGTPAPSPAPSVERQALARIVDAYDSGGLPEVVEAIEKGREATQATRPLAEGQP